MKPGWQVGSIFGIPLLIDTSWFIILALFTWSYGLSLQQQPGYDPVTAWVTGLVLSLALFGSVLLHELGHSLVARSQGITVNSITLFLFGGVASIDRESKTPEQAFQVAIAGPAVSFTLFLLLALLSQGVTSNTPAHLVASTLSGINLALALFNMIPGLPLDGGQVLKAAVWKATGSRIKGLRWAARSGQMLGWAAIALGLMIYLQSPANGFDALWIGLIGWFVINNASSYSRVSDVQEAVGGLQAVTVMTREFRVVDAKLTLQAFNENYVQKESGIAPTFFATLDGRYRGMVKIEDLQEIERSLWDTTTLDTIVHPLLEIPSVAETTPLSDVIDKLDAQELRSITVLSPAGAVAGMIDRGDIVRAVVEKLKVPVPDTLINRIKEEGTYPPGLPLGAIAKSLNQGD